MVPNLSMQSVSKIYLKEEIMSKQKKHILSNDEINNCSSNGGQLDAEYPTIYFCGSSIIDEVTFSEMVDGGVSYRVYGPVAAVYDYDALIADPIGYNTVAIDTDCIHFILNYGDDEKNFWFNQLHKLLDQGEETDILQANLGNTKTYLDTYSNRVAKVRIVNSKYGTNESILEEVHEVIREVNRCDFDKSDLVKEIGDVLFNLTCLCQDKSINLIDVFESNLNKIKLPYNDRNKQGDANVSIN
jgi:phosphoribosyl-ATP pyrophosphohydrolase